MSLSDIAWSGKRVVVLGDVCIDEWEYGRIDRISPEAPVPILTLDKVTRSPGMAALVAEMVRALGGEPILATVLDGEGQQWLISKLHSDTILETDENRLISIKRRSMAAIEGRSQYFQVLRADMEDCWPIEEAIARKLANKITDLERPDAVLISDYGKGVVTPWLANNVIGWCRHWEVPCIVDPARTADWSTYAGASAIKANRKESRGQEIPSPYADVTIVTRDSEGCSLWLESVEQKLPAVKIDVADPTGAGDQFLAALGLSIAAGAAWSDGCRVANIAAALQAMSAGCVPVEREDLMDLQDAQV